MSRSYPTSEEIISLVERLNAQVFDVIGYGCFGYHTDGTNQAICIDDFSLWDDAEDPREYIDAEDEYEELEPFVRKAAKDYAGRIILGLGEDDADEHADQGGHDAPSTG
jgi:hypothetical protein